MEVPPPVASHVVAMPYPGRGHINPMMNLCKLLISKNTDILVTFVVTEEWVGFIGSEPRPDNIRLGSIPNVIPSELTRADNFPAFIDAAMTKMEGPFEQLLDRLEPPPTIIVYDTYLFWVVDVANRRNIPVASFWPMSTSFFSVLLHYGLLEQNGHYPVNWSENGDKRVDYIPGNSSIRLADFPLNDGSDFNRRLLQWALKAPLEVHKAQYLLLSSIYELEPQAIDALKAEFSLPICTLGPLIPSFTHGMRDNIPSLSSNPSDLSYFKWLDSQPSSSVLYVSQGSFLSVSGAQMDEIAAGLRDSGVRFLWVARGEASRLKQLCGNKGLILEWCDQIRVLLHPAIGGFWTHCGWNSTKEGVFAGVPFLTFPILMDQPLNSKLIVEDWKVGWRVSEGVRKDILVSKDEIARLVQKFMHLTEGEMGREMRKRARELQQKCQLAIGDGGSSENDVHAFMRDIIITDGNTKKVLQTTSIYSS
ncbi:hypothetical protein L6164_023957 [Bauhinia variegata]|uniref:Uncharacterized protein n=1 Tax=Bauhinia variegata TaxID=167791 RepID=A0ACB9LVR2_BAUVA|nr:hypothetical protein L6164_023957 [Bauhinia variegata]